MPLFKSTSTSLSLSLSHNAPKNYYFSRRIDRSIGIISGRIKAGPLIKPREAKSSINGQEAIYRFIDWRGVFHESCRSFAMNEETEEERVIAIRFPTCAQSNPRALSLLRHRSIVGISNADFILSFEPAIPEMTGCDSARPPLSMHCHTFSMIQRGKDSVRARPTANWLADPSDRRIIKDVLARIYLSYLVVEIDRYNSVWIELGRGYHRFLARCSTRYTMIR